MALYTSDYIRLPNGKWIKIINNKPYPFCEVCGSVDHLEVHHWAPRCLFDTDADLWPTALLCRACHLRWHKLVTPNMCKNKE